MNKKVKVNLQRKLFKSKNFELKSNAFQKLK